MGNILHQPMAMMFILPSMISRVLTVTRQPLALRKKLDERREQEAFGRACNQNLKRLCYLNYTENIDPKANWPK